MQTVPSVSDIAEQGDYHMDRLRVGKSFSKRRPDLGQYESRLRALDK